MVKKGSKKSQGAPRRATRRNTNRPSPSAKKAQNPAASTEARGANAASNHGGAGEDGNIDGEDDDSGDPENISRDDQQRLLNIFSESFADILSSEKLPALLQEIKQALFNREFAKAFGREDYLEAYAARWSPTRALCYASVLDRLEAHLDEIAYPVDTPPEKGSENGGEEADGAEAAADNEEDDSSTTEDKKHIRMVSIGGCAAEQVAFASHLHQTSLSGHLTLVDSGPWSHITSLIQDRLTSPPQISKYASAAIRASNVSLIDQSQLQLHFSQQDVLNMDRPSLQKLLLAAEGGEEEQQPLIVSILFTLNELYTSGGIGKTTTFLGNLGHCLPSGSLLLVLDSPGSYSEAAVGKEQKKYPLHWLLDHTLLKAGTAGAAKWEKLESDESIWFRMPEGLAYPIQLENMRYQMHLYRIERAS